MYILIYLILSIFVIFRLTLLLTKESGPGAIFLKLRFFMQDKFNIELLECFNCTSIWVSIPFALYCKELMNRTIIFVGYDNIYIVDLIILWLALSGCSIILNKIYSSKETTINKIGEIEETVINE